MMTRSLQDAMDEAGGAVNLLWNSQSPPSVVPRVPAEYSNWQGEQLVSRETCALYDQSHHMNNFAIEGPDAKRFLSRLGVNDLDNFPVNKAKQFVACNDDGFVIGESILFHMDEDKYLLVGIVPMMNWVEYNLSISDYDIESHRDENSLNRVGDPKRYRYQLQGPRAFDILHDALGAEPPNLKFFNMGEIEIAGCTVRALRHGMAGEPGYELFGPWEDNEAVLGALLAAGEKHGLKRVGGSAYHSIALESGYLPRPLPAIYTNERLAGYRQWLKDTAYEATAPLGGSLKSDDIRDYYYTPYDLGYGRVISFDHDFIGSAALQQMVADGRDSARTKVSLIWNGNDVEEAIGSMFRPGLGAKLIKFPMSLYATFQYDTVASGDETIGSATWTGYLASERAIVSIAVVNSAFAEPGTEVEIVWGEEPNSQKAQVEPHRQVRLRATVAPAPLAEFARTAYRAEKLVTY